MRRAARRPRPCARSAGSAGRFRPARPPSAAMLEPYQMVRSLQLVQDRIAAGDHAALPMQRKLLEMIDQRFRKAKSHDFIDRRNYQAMLVYAMSGGNPATIDSMLARLHLERDRPRARHRHSRLSRGDAMTARDALAPVDPLKQPPELGAFLALVKGSVAARRRSASRTKNVRRGAAAQPGHAGRGGRAQALHRACIREQGRRAFPASPAASMCAATCSLPTPANSPMPWSPASSHCARRSIWRRSTTSSPAWIRSGRK